VVIARPTSRLEAVTARGPVAIGEAATARQPSRPEGAAGMLATSGSTTHNIGVALPIRTGQPPTGLAVPHAETPWPTVKQAPDNKSGAKAGTCAAPETLE